MKTFLLFILSLVVSLHVHAQSLSLPFAVYKSPTRSTTKRSSEPVVIPPSFYFGDDYLYDDSNVIVKKERISSNALCVENGAV